jgi:transcriptional regulator with XRE-family HTH domain
MSSRRPRTVEDLTHDQRAVVEAARAEWRTPESRADEETIRQLVREEVPSAAPDEELRFVLTAMKRERIRLGLSLKDVEDRIGIDRSTISRLETGGLANPTWATLKAYARGLGVSLRLVMAQTASAPIPVSSRESRHALEANPDPSGDAIKQRPETPSEGAQVL